MFVGRVGPKDERLDIVQRDEAFIGVVIDDR